MTPQERPAARPRTDPDPGTGLGLLLSRAEEASLAWGRPLDSYAPDPRPFDPKAAERWVRRNGVRTDTWSPGLEFIAQPFEGVPSLDEARWWLWWFHAVAVGSTIQVRTPGEHLKAVRAAYAQGTEPPAGPWPWNLGEYAALGAELTRKSITEVAGPRISDQGWVDSDLLPALRALVMPQFTPAQRQAGFDHFAFQTDVFHHARLSALFRSGQDSHVAAVDRLPDDVLVRTWHDERGGSHAYFGWEYVRDLFGALPTQADALAAWDRLGPHRNPTESTDIRLDHVAEVLAVVGNRALPFVVERSLGAEDRYESTAFLALLAARVHGPDAVPSMVTLARRHRHPDLAKTWLASHPLALAAHPDPFDRAERPLVEAAVRQALGTDPDVFTGGIANPTVADIVARIRAEDADGRVAISGEEPGWWHDAVAAEAAVPVPDATGGVPIPRKLPAWADPSALPPVVVDGVRLTPDQLREVLLSSARGINDDLLRIRPLAAAVRERLTPPARDDLALRLLRGWAETDAPSPNRVAVAAAAFLGAEGFAQELAGLLRDWPGKSQHRRAALGLRVLAASDTPTGLQAVCAVANRSRHPTQQALAVDLRRRLADARGLSVPQLEDRAVPDGGLDARGGRVLSFGARRLRVTLSPQGKPVVRELDADGNPTGRPRPSLPAPRAADDRDAVEAARAEFRVFRTQLGDLARLQTIRLEQAMVTGRTWAATEHAGFVAGNPLLRSLVQPLVWAIADGDGRVLARVGEDGGWLGVDEDDLSPSGAAEVSLPHPLDLTGAERSAWQAHLADHDLVAPFDQLDRYTATPGGLTGTRLPEEFLPGVGVDPRALVGTLERLGGGRGPTGDGAMVDYCELPFPAFGQFVVLGAAHMIGWPRPTRVEYVELCPSGGDAFDRLDWSQAHPRVLSETLRVLAILGERPAPT